VIIFEVVYSFHFNIIRWEMVTPTQLIYPLGEMHWLWTFASSHFHFHSHSLDPGHSQDTARTQLGPSQDHFGEPQFNFCFGLGAVFCSSSVVQLFRFLLSVARPSGRQRQSFCGASLVGIVSPEIPWPRIQFHFVLLLLLLLRQYPA